MEYTKLLDYLLWGISIVAIGIVFIRLLLYKTPIIKTNYSDEKEKKATIPYYLPDTIIRITAIAKVEVIYDQNNLQEPTNCRVFELSFVANSEITPDTSKVLAINHFPNIFSDDEIELKVNSKGLLTNVNVASEDKTSKIISELQSAPKVILAPSTTVQELEKKKLILKEFTKEFIFFNLTDFVNGKCQKEWEICIFNETVNAIVEKIPISVVFKIDKTIDKNENPKENNKFEGILSRPMMQISFDITPTKTTNGGNSSSEEVFGKNVQLPVSTIDTSKLLIIPIQRGLFIKQKHTIELADGVVLSNKISWPSLVEGFISIPINIAKAIVSIPAQLIQFKIDTTKKSAELEKAKLEIEKEILTLKNEVEKLKNQEGE